MQAQCGRFDFDDGGSFVGEWMQSKAHGLGLATGPRHHQGEFSGEWRNGYEACGVYVWPSGNTYAGGWSRGKRHGEGAQLKGRWCYRGSFTAGLCGKYGVKNSVVSRESYEGTWHLNKLDGYGVERLADGSTYAGAWSNGQKHGLGVQNIFDSGSFEETSSTGLRPVSSSVEEESNKDTCTTSSVQFESQEDASVKSPSPGLSATASSHSQLATQCSSSSSSSGAHTSASCVSRKALLGRALMRRLRKQHSASELLRTLPSSPRKTATAVQPSTPQLTASVVNVSVNLAKHGSKTNSTGTASPVVQKHTRTRIPGSNIENVTIARSDISSKTMSSGSSRTGEVYTGQWRDNQRTGYGILERSNGYNYTGEWLENRRHGLGVTRYADGTVEEGRYRVDKLILELNRKNRLQMLRHVKIKDLLEEAVKKAKTFGKEAREKAAENAYIRAQTARALASTADEQAAKAQELSEQARTLAKHLSPDFVQPGPVWEEKRHATLARIMKKNCLDLPLHPSHAWFTKSSVSERSHTSARHLSSNLGRKRSPIVEVRQAGPQQSIIDSRRRPYSAPVSCGQSWRLSADQPHLNNDTQKSAGSASLMMGVLCEQTVECEEDTVTPPTVSVNRMSRSADVPDLATWDNAAATALLEHRAQSEERSYVTRLNVCGSKHKGSVRQSSIDFKIENSPVLEETAIDQEHLKEDIPPTPTPVTESVPPVRKPPLATTKSNSFEKPRPEPILRHTNSLQTEDEQEKSNSKLEAEQLRKCLSSTAIFSQEKQSKIEAASQAKKLLDENDPKQPIRNVPHVAGQVARFRSRPYLRGGRYRGFMQHPRPHLSANQSNQSGSLRTQDSGYHSTEPGDSFSSSLLGVSYQLSRDISLGCSLPPPIAECSNAPEDENKEELCQDTVSSADSVRSLASSNQNSGKPSRHELLHNNDISTPTVNKKASLTPLMLDSLSAGSPNTKQRSNRDNNDKEWDQNYAGLEPVVEIIHDAVYRDQSPFSRNKLSSRNTSTSDSLYSHGNTSSYHKMSSRTSSRPLSSPTVWTRHLAISSAVRNSPHFGQSATATNCQVTPNPTPARSSNPSQSKGRQQKRPSVRNRQQYPVEYERCDLEEPQVIPEGTNPRVYTPLKFKSEPRFSARQYPAEYDDYYDREYYYPCDWEYGPTSLPMYNEYDQEGFSNRHLNQPITRQSHRPHHPNYPTQRYMMDHQVRAHSTDEMAYAASPYDYYPVQESLRPHLYPDYSKPMYYRFSNLDAMRLVSPQQAVYTDESFSPYTDDYLLSSNETSDPYFDPYWFDYSYESESGLDPRIWNPHRAHKRVNSRKSNTQNNSQSATRSAATHPSHSSKSKQYFDQNSTLSSQDESRSTSSIGRSESLDRIAPLLPSLEPSTPTRFLPTSASQDSDETTKFSAISMSSTPSDGDRKQSVELPSSTISSGSRKSSNTDCTVRVRRSVVTLSQQTQPVSHSRPEAIASQTVELDTVVVHLKAIWKLVWHRIKVTVRHLHHMPLVGENSLQFYIQQWIQQHCVMFMIILLNICLVSLFLSYTVYRSSGGSNLSLTDPTLHQPIENNKQNLVPDQHQQ